MTTAALSFGALDIKLEEPLFGMLDAGEPWIAALADGADWGTPEAVVATVGSMLMDGEKSSITRFGNRVAVIPLKITGENLDVVAAGEALVMAEVNKGNNAFAWTPPGPATTSVFDVVFAKLDFKIDDLAEKRVTRYFTLTLECWPFPRPLDLTVLTVEPIPGTTPTFTEIDGCSSLTGWAATVGAPLTIVSGNIRAGGMPWDAERTGLAVSVAAEPYLIVELSGPVNPSLIGTPQGTVVIINGVTAPLALTELISGGYRCHFAIPGTVTTINTIQIGGSAATTMDLFRVAKTNVLPTVGSLHQRSFSLPIAGTARAQVDLAVESDDGGLGRDVVLYSAFDGSAAAPASRQWLHSSATPASSPTAVSGYRHALSSPSVYRRPVLGTPPGMYLLLTRLSKTGSAANVTINWSAELGGHALNSAAPAAQTGSVVANLSTTDKLVEVGIAELPPAVVDPMSGAYTEFEITASDATAHIDDLFIFNLDTGVLSIVSGTAAVTASKFKVRSASLNNERPGWVLGIAGTDVDDIDAARLMLSAGIHELPPGASDVFVITTASESQNIVASYYRRYQHHVVDEDS